MLNLKLAMLNKCIQNCFDGNIRLVSFKAATAKATLTSRYNGLPSPVCFQNKVAGETFVVLLAIESALDTAVVHQTRRSVLPEHYQYFLKLSHTYSLLLYLFNFLSHKITKKE
jgi:hypothetical protein